MKNKTFLSFCLSFFGYLSLNKKPISTRYSAHYKEFITVFMSLYLRMEIFFIYIKRSTLLLRTIPVSQGVAHRQTNFTLPCGIPLWNSTAAHSPSNKELNPSSQEDVRFSGLCTLAYRFHFKKMTPLCGSATAHSLSDKELISSSLEKSYFSGLSCIMLSNYPTWALFSLLLT